MLKEALAEPSQADEYLWTHEYLNVPEPTKPEPVKAKAPRKTSQRKKQAIIIKHTTDVEKEDK